MHRNVKGLLSLILTFAMVTVTAAPASAEELSGEQQTAEEQMVVEAPETESEPAPEQIVAEVETVPAEEQSVMEVLEITETEPETVELEVMTEEESSLIPAWEQLTEETLEEAETAEAETTAVEQNTAEAEPALTSDTQWDYLYSKLAEAEKQFRVYSGTDISSELKFMDAGIVPDSENLDVQGGSLVKALLELREGDLKFYRLSQWRVWKVDSNGSPNGVLTEEFYLSKAATKSNFEQSVYLINNGTGTNPEVSCHKPILEPVWSCLDYTIPVYDADGNDTGTTITVNAENYNSVLFPNAEADSWKLLYAGTECPLSSASEIWTNQVNGIRTIGRDFDGSQAKLQAVVSQTVLQEGTAEFMQPDWYEGQPKPEPIVSSETNGVENITYYYKAAGADDSTYTTTVPDKAGAYTAVAVFAATELYQEVIKAADFRILPVEVVLQEGTAEFVQSGWYEGQPKPAPVVSSETNGVENITYYYKEAEADDSAYTMAVPEKAGKYTAKAVFAATELYQEVVRTSDFEILSIAPIEEVDVTAPVISGVSNGETCYGDQTVTITDEKLHMVTVNGEAVEIVNSRADITLKPAEDVYKIVAVDEAGNKTELTVEVLETWVRDGIMDNGKKKLRRERLYKLGGGQWTIDGDSTVYSGGRAFYVKNGGEYDFRRK